MRCLAYAVIAATGALGAIIHLDAFRSDQTPPRDVASRTRIPKPPKVATSLQHQCVERAQRLRRQLTSDHVVSIHSPFVLAGDPAIDLQHEYDKVIQPATRMLNRRFFDRTPDRPLRILLHSSETTYRSNAERLFCDHDISRFGYFKPGRYAVLANLAEGDAALRHELVHALMHFDFPNAPPWLQEGMATLYEAIDCSTDASGPCWKPIPSWRLAILQRALNATRPPRLRQLVHAPHLEGPREAVLYAEARYLCMYLHRVGRLESVYRGVRKDVQRDPSGELGLLAAFPGCSWSDLERRFHPWVLELKWEKAK
jgi:hypothetical protein